MRKLVRRSRWMGPGTLVVLLFLAGAYVVHELTPPPAGTGTGAPAGAPVYFDVVRGARLSVVAAELADSGLVRNPFLFTLLGRATGTDRRIKAGEYAVRPGTPALELLSLLQRGMSSLDQVTIPEGLTAREIARVLFDHSGVDTAAFLRAVRNPSFAARMGVKASGLEGYLFPETYSVLRGSRAEDVARLMVAHGMRVLREEMSAASSPPPYTAHEIVTMASIVEAEAQDPHERSRIAAVYYNRLKQGMRLQADPTVAYAMGGRPERIFYRNLELDSPYNTYRNYGLPPGPICSPGRAALHAALNPAGGSDALFFVSRGDGTHQFSSSMKEHARAIARIRSASSTAVRVEAPR
ncbi:MAG: endolytic transglycosylase MltG [Candidatus Eisenbacteria bacterium]|nr:endolytic transglycosylase MltG [Candidatus Eisenbacteria bacterium]